MSVNEAARSHLFDAAASGRWDPDAAETLMSLLPPVGWADVATKQDLATLERTVRSEMSSGFDTLRAEFHQEFGAIRQEFGELRGELRGEMATMRGELTAEIHRTNRQTLVAMVGAMIAMNAATVGAVSLLV